MTRDSSGKLGIHFSSGEEKFSPLEERFYCGWFLSIFHRFIFSATFSINGAIIYGINYRQELCIIDPLNAQILSKRKIDELKTPSETIPIQIIQVTPKVMAIGALCGGHIESSIPHLLLLCGDLLDPQAKINLTLFEMPLSQSMHPQKLPDFRFHYVKEVPQLTLNEDGKLGQLLFFSHSESSQVQTLHLDESIILYKNIL